MPALPRHVAVDITSLSYRVAALCATETGRRHQSVRLTLRFQGYKTFIRRRLQELIPLGLVH